jgi:lipopolysaccharide transport system ATP-binding protein
VRIHGNTTSILDIGNNFHPDLTGRDNVLMQLKLDNNDKPTLISKIEKIKTFSEIGDFFDQPVKVYSNGMFLRLAFSLAFETSSDVIILDEVLSVGDEGFRLKCQALLKEMSEQGKTILFASHNRQEILELSNKCVWLEKGHIRSIGVPSELLGFYFARHKDNFDRSNEIVEISEINTNVKTEDGTIDLCWTANNAPKNNIIGLKNLTVKAESETRKIVSSNPFVISLLLEKKIENVKIGIFFFIQDVFYQSVMVGSLLKALNTSDISLETKDYIGNLRFDCTVPQDFLMPGKYYLQLRLGVEPNEWNEQSQEVLRFSEKLSFEVFSPVGYIETIGDLTKGSVRPRLDWKLTKISE